MIVSLGRANHEPLDLRSVARLGWGRQVIVAMAVGATCDTQVNDSDIQKTELVFSPPCLPPPPRLIAYST